MSDIVRDPYGNPLNRDKLITALRAENEKLRQVLENTQQARVLQGKAITDASNEIERLRAALIGVLWMAEKWFKHGGDETTFADDYEAKLEAARAAITEETT